jgi:hypothetical protein
MKIYGVLGLMVGACLISVGCGDDEKESPHKSGGGTAGTINAAGSDEGSDDTTGSGGRSAAGSGGRSAAGSGGRSAAGNGGGGSGGHEAGGGGMAGSGGSMAPTKFESKPAGVELEVDAESKAAGISLRSSSLIQDTGTSLGYTEWRAALYNGTNETQCFIAVNADFQDAAGTSIIKFESYAYGAAYDSGSGIGLTITCAAAGETVPIWSNANPKKVLPIASAKKLVIEVTPMARPEAVLHPSTPELGPLTKEFTNLDWWVVSGRATAKADIYNVEVAFWGKVGEFFVDDSADFHSEDFLQGQTWDFETIAGIDSVQLDEVVTYFDFIEGSSGALARRSLSPRDAELATARSAATTAWDAARARRDAGRVKR